ncbi:hypothetical protein HPG69_002400 [Diceros bicornis minor]|uniref:Uncharacterized protein n=1 Tax=Diceros bicornis minor TaxID=77932 RepID=A0A7J7FP80_DICBM|nr:hypothetical protein HPG69_002400 [Diceros bicornis minor]
MSKLEKRKRKLRLVCDKHLRMQRRRWKLSCEPRPCWNEDGKLLPITRTHILLLESRELPKILLAKKSLQKLDPHQKDDMLRGVEPQSNNTTPSEQFESLCIDFTSRTTEEQKLLEQALKMYPVNIPERWGKNSRNSIWQDQKGLPEMT